LKSSYTISSESARWRLVQLQLSHPEIELGTLSLEDVSRFTRHGQVKQHSISQYDRLLGQFAQKHPSVAQVITLTERFDPCMMGSYGYLLRSQPDGRAFLDRLTRYHYLSSNYERALVDAQGGSVVLRLSLDAGLDHHTTDELLHSIVTYRMLVSFFGVDAIQHVSLPPHATSAEKALGELMQGRLGTEGAMPTFFLDPRILEASLPDQDPILAMTLETLAHALSGQSTESSVSAKVTAALQLDQLGPKASVEDVASHLGMSVRTLQRRLNLDGQSFSTVADQARKELALTLLLCTSEPVSQVAETLGFLELSSFYRSFKQWYGSTPAKFRQENQLSLG